MRFFGYVKKQLRTVRFKGHCDVVTVTSRRYSMEEQQLSSFQFLFSLLNVLPTEASFYFLIARLVRSIGGRAGIGRPLLAPPQHRAGHSPLSLSLLLCSLVGFDPDAGIRRVGLTARSRSLFLFRPSSSALIAVPGVARGIAQDRTCQFASAYIAR